MLLTIPDVLEKAHTIASTELGLEELPSHIQGYEQETWAKIMLKGYEQELDRFKPHARHEDFAMPDEDEAIDHTLRFLEDAIYVALVD